MVKLTFYKLTKAKLPLAILNKTKQIKAKLP